MGSQALIAGGAPCEILFDVLVWGSGVRPYTQSCFYLKHWLPTTPTGASCRCKKKNEFWWTAAAGLALVQENGEDVGPVGPHTEGAAAAGAPSTLAQGAATASASGRVFSKATQTESNHRFCSLLRDILCDPWWLSWLLGPMSTVFNVWTEIVRFRKHLARLKMRWRRYKWTWYRRRRI